MLLEKIHDLGVIVVVLNRIIPRGRIEFAIVHGKVIYLRDRSWGGMSNVLTFVMQFRANYIFLIPYGSY